MHPQAVAATYSGHSIEKLQKELKHFKTGYLRVHFLWVLFTLGSFPDTLWPQQFLNFEDITSEILNPYLKMFSLGSS